MVEELLSQVKLNNKAVPYAHIKYVHKSDTYMTYTYLAETPILQGDDYPLNSSVEVDVDIYTKSEANMTSILQQLMALFVNAGWCWAETSADLYEEDTKFFHKTITFETERTILWQQSV